MPAAPTGVTIKMFDGVTDIYYVTKKPASGDKDPFVSRQEANQPATMPPAFFPVWTITSQWNAQKTARQVRSVYEYPYATQDTSTGVWSAKDRVRQEFFASFPQAIPTSVTNQAAHQGVNLLASATFKSTLVDQYAPS